MPSTGNLLMNVSAVHVFGKRLLNRCMRFCCRHTRTQSTMRRPLWRSFTASLHWQSLKLCSLSITPIQHCLLTTRATVSLPLRHAIRQPYAMALLATLMLCCTSRCTSAFCHPHTHRIWPVGFPFTSQSSSQYSCWPSSSWKWESGGVGQTTKYGMSGVSLGHSVLPYTTLMAGRTL